MCASATISTRYCSFPEKQKVDGVSENLTLSGNPLRYLTTLSYIMYSITVNPKIESFLK